MLSQNNDGSGLKTRQTGCDGDDVPVVLTQFQAELGSGSHWKVAGAGVRQSSLPGVRLWLGLRGLPRPGAVAGQQCGQTEGLSGRVTYSRQMLGGGEGML